MNSTTCASPAAAASALTEEKTILKSKINYSSACRAENAMIPDGGVVC
jgi:hypothetical protein